MKVIITKPRNIVHHGDCGHTRKAAATVTYSGKRGDTYAKHALSNEVAEYGTCGACVGRLEGALA